MAEVALGVAGSVVGIVSLAGQLCVGIQELYAFLDSVKDADIDLKCIKDDVVFLQNAVQWIRRDCTDSPKHVDARLLRMSLELCNSRITRLLAIVEPSENTDHRTKALRKLRATAKKKRMLDFVRDLDSAKMSLMLVHQLYIRENALNCTVGGASQTLTGGMSSGESAMRHDPTCTNSRVEECPMHIRTQTIINSATSVNEYQFLLGKLSTKSISSRAITRKCDSTRITQFETEKKTFKLELARWLAPLNIELQALRRWGNWTYQLRHWRVISANALLFELCQDGDLKNVQRLLSKRLASPFDVSPTGETVLHYAARSGHPELVSFFLQIGADAGAETITGESAFQYAMGSPREDKHLELARLFIDRGQVDPMASGSQYGIIHAYHGPPETFEYMIKQHTYCIGPEERNKQGKTILHHQILHRLYYGDSFERIKILFITGHHIIDSRITDDGVYVQFGGYTALHCAVERWSWAKTKRDEHTEQQAKSVVQCLLERGENVHAMSRGRRFTPLTAIGEMVIDSPNSSQVEVIREWLGLLSKAGYDLNDYLLTEAKLEQQRPETWPHFRLTFEEENGQILPLLFVSSSVSMARSQDRQVPINTESSAATDVRKIEVPNTESSTLPFLRLSVLSHYAQHLVSYLSIGLNASPATTLLVIVLGCFMVLM